MRAAGHGRLSDMPTRPVPPRFAAALFGLGLGALAAVASSPAAALEPETAGEDVSAIPSLAERKRQRELELEAIRRSLTVSERRQEALRGEMQGIETDRAKLSTELIGTAQRLQRTETEIAAIEARLEELHANEDGIRQSLSDRRGILVEVLMALQRMGRTPPPAMLSRPEDALAAIRGSILAGAVLPDIRVEAEALAADLQQLTQLSARIEEERNRLAARYAALGEEQARVNLLIATKRAQRDQTEAALKAEQDKAAEFAAKAETLQGLIQSLESESGTAATAEQTAAVAPPADASEAARRLADTSRIAPAMRFADAKGLLGQPVSGTPVLGYGEPDGLGGTAQGLSIATRPGARVVSPVDGWVAYAGPFRSYGQVLILNAGDGYHVVMAGMERVDAALGQFVLAGEPVAEMGARRLASLGALAADVGQPILYVEFRKDGAAIDPAPWWAPASLDEVRG